MPRRQLVIFTGAGISAESGLATFRGQDGLWQNHKIDDVCNGYTWFKNRDLVHSFYNDLRVRLEQAEPNAAHLMVARLQDEYNATIITANVDDLHERAAESEIVEHGKIIHLHGKLTEMTCTQCKTPWDIGYRAWSTDHERCPNCGTRKLVRPNVIFFGEEAPRYADLYEILESLTESDVLVVIGTSAAVVNIGAMAYQSPAHTLLCNLTAEPELVRTGLESNFEVAIYGQAAQSTHAVEDQIRKWLR